jgi:hypothetical protein
VNPWSTDPCWQNFSSLCREAVAAREAPNEIGKFHHLTSSLYFGIASLEAFLNQSMRAHLAARSTEESIFERLRKTRFLTKFGQWPKEILQATPSVAASTMDLLRLFNEVRGDLTHPKTRGDDIYRKLETVDPDSVVTGVAEYIVRFLEVRKEVFPYWLLGWNYLNPRPNTHEIWVINNQQFSHSLLSLGFRLPAWEAGPAAAWREQNMSSFSGYLAIKRGLDGLNRCEPKDPRFPHKPILCQRWWTVDHHRTCGHVTQEAIRRAVDGGA